MSPRWAMLVSAAFGFTALSSELLWYRAFSFANGGHASAFGLLLAAYLLGVALGALAIESTFRGEAQPTSAHRMLLARIAAAGAVAGYLALPSFALFLGWAGGGEQIPLFALTATFMGATFPLLCFVSVRPDGSAGAGISQLYLANIIGSTLGSLLTGFVLFDLMPLRQVALLVLLQGLVIAAGLVLTSGADKAVRTRALAALVVLAVTSAGTNGFVFSSFYERLQWKTLTPEPFVEVVETRSGVITVGSDGRIYGGGGYDGAFSLDLEDDMNGIRRAYLAGAVHPRPRRVLVIGLSSGSWAQVLANNPDVEEVTILEINAGYLKLLPLHEEVASLLQNPKVRIIVDDGRRWLSRRGERFDLVVANATQHWRGYAANLLSREFVRLVKGSLEEGGIYVFNPTGSPSAMKTAVSEFRHSATLASAVAVSDAPISLSESRWRELLSGYRIDGRSVIDLETDQGRAMFEKLVADSGFIADTREGTLTFAADATIVTDDNMFCEWHRNE